MFSDERKYSSRSMFSKNDVLLFLFVVDVVLLLCMFFTTLTNEFSTPLSWC